MVRCDTAEYKKRLSSVCTLSVSVADRSGMVVTTATYARSVVLVWKVVKECDREKPMALCLMLLNKIARRWLLSKGDLIVCTQVS